MLKLAIKKYGSKNFKVDLIEVCDTLESLNDREIYWITYYDARKSKDFYNIHRGGDGGDISLWIPENEMEVIRKNHSDYIKNRIQTDSNFKSVFSGAKQGHKCYQSTKEKIREG